MLNRESGNRIVGSRHNHGLPEQKAFPAYHTTRPETLESRALEKEDGPFQTSTAYSLNPCTLGAALGGPGDAGRAGSRLGPLDQKVITATIK